MACCTITTVVGRVTQQDCELIVDQVSSAESPQDSISEDVFLSEGEPLIDRLRQEFIDHTVISGKGQLEYGQSLLTKPQQIRGAKAVIHLPSPRFTSKRRKPTNIERYRLQQQYCEIVRTAVKLKFHSIALPFLSSAFGCDLWHAQISALQSLLPHLPASFNRIVFVVDAQSAVESFRKIIHGQSSLAITSTIEGVTFSRELCDVHIQPPRQPSRRSLVKCSKPQQRKRKNQAVDNIIDNFVSTFDANASARKQRWACVISVAVGRVEETSTEAVVTLNCNAKNPERGVDGKILAIEGKGAILKIRRAFSAYKEANRLSSLRVGDALSTWSEKIAGAKMLIHVVSPQLRDPEHLTDDEKLSLFRTYSSILQVAADEEASTLSLPILGSSAGSSRAALQMAALHAALSNAPSRLKFVCFCVPTKEDEATFKKMINDLNYLPINDDNEAICIRDELCKGYLEVPAEYTNAKKDARKIITIDGDIVDVIEENSMASKELESISSPLDLSNAFLYNGPSLGRVLKQAMKTLQPAFSTTTESAFPSVAAPSPLIFPFDSSQWLSVIQIAEASEMTEKMSIGELTQNFDDESTATTSTEPISPNENVIEKTETDDEPAPTEVAESTTKIEEAETPQEVADEDSSTKKRGRPKRDSAVSPPETKRKRTVEETLLMSTRWSTRLIKKPTTVMK